MSMVLTDLITRHGLPIAVATLETGKLHAQTLALVQRAEQHYGLTIELHRPREEAVLHFVQRNGDDAMFRSIELRKACCALRFFPGYYQGDVDERRPLFARPAGEEYATEEFNQAGSSI